MVAYISYISKTWWKNSLPKFRCRSLLRSLSMSKFNSSRILIFVMESRPIYKTISTISSSRVIIQNVILLGRKIESSLWRFAAEICRLLMFVVLKKSQLSDTVFIVCTLYDGQKMKIWRDGKVSLYSLNYWSRTCHLSTLSLFASKVEFEFPKWKHYILECVLYVIPILFIHSSAFTGTFGYVRYGNLETRWRRPIICTKARSTLREEPVRLLTLNHML